MNHQSPAHALAEAARLCRPVRLLFISLALLAAAQLAMAGVPGRMIQGKIIHVEDGDTVTLLDHNLHQHKIRLADIDAPETCHSSAPNEQVTCKGKPGQPYGENAKASLRSLAIGQETTAWCRSKKSYERSVCYLKTNAGVNLNHEQVALGWAWFSRKHGEDGSLYLVELQARARRAGLWRGRNPIDPAEWRNDCWKQGNCPQ